MIADDFTYPGFDRKILPLGDVIGRLQGGPYILVSTNRQYAMVVTEPPPAMQEFLVLT